VTQHPLDGSLLAPGPHPGYGTELGLFGQFIGHWDMKVRFFDERDNCTFDGIGNWSFGWILDGRAIQDVLEYALPDVYPEPHGVRRIGTSLRSYSPADGTWRVTWVGATADIYLSLTARADSDRILITGLGIDGKTPLEWAFSEIRDDSFEWTGRLADRNGGWRLQQSMSASRRA
jgi:hypothetical protein